MFNSYCGNFTLVCLDVFDARRKNSAWSFFSYGKDSGEFISFLDVFCNLIFNPFLIEQTPSDREMSFAKQKKKKSFLTTYGNQFVESGKPVHTHTHKPIIFVIMGKALQWKMIPEVA